MDKTNGGWGQHPNTSKRTRQNIATPRPEWAAVRGRYQGSVPLRPADSELAVPLPHTEASPYRWGESAPRPAGREGYGDTLFSQHLPVWIGSSGYLRLGQRRGVTR